MARVTGSPMLRAAAEAVLRPYAQIVFSRNLASGVLVFLAIASFPALALATLAAIAVAHAVSLLLGLGSAAVRDGGYGCVAVLTTLATAVFSQDGSTPPLIGLGAVLAVVFTAAFNALFVKLALPTHSLPFVAAAWTVNLAARVQPAGVGVLSLMRPAAWMPAPLEMGGWLNVPAAILFLHGAAAGALVLLAIAVHSRIALLLAGIGAATAECVRTALRAGVAWSTIDLTASFNAVLAAIALGGIWFVPHPASLLLAAGGAAVTCVITYSLFPAAGVLGLPVLSLAFVLTTQLVMGAARMREHDRRPATARGGDRPEDVLETYLMRVRRFGEFAWLPFRLPFRGTWRITQGHDGAHTHKGAWRHAFDFEVAGPDGRTFDRDGTDARDYRCYGLPVLAAGAGTVDQVLDGIPDNPVGKINVRENWGNTVVIGHASGLYSVCAHLQPRSIRVKPGDLVAAGTEIGRCGNSGRSAVPHLHFHVQRGAPLGSETVAADFGDVVSPVAGGARIGSRVIPAEGDAIRPVMRDEALARALEFTPGTSWVFSDAASGRREVATVEVDLWGRRLLRSDDARLYVEPYESGLVVIAFDGNDRSLMRYLLLALARVPFDQESSLTWTDRVPRRLMRTWARNLVDLLATVAPRLAELEITYTSKRSEGALTVEGTGPSLATRAVVSLAGRAHRIVVRHGGHQTEVQFGLTPTVAETQG